jgi:hypothetical protein
MQPSYRLRLALRRILITALALTLGLGALSALGGCERRLGEDKQLTPSQPRPDSQPDRPAR